MTVEPSATFLMFTKTFIFWGYEVEARRRWEESGASLVIPQYVTQRFVSRSVSRPADAESACSPTEAVVQFWRPTEFGLSMWDEGVRYRQGDVSQHRQTIESCTSPRQCITMKVVGSNL